MIASSSVLLGPAVTKMAVMPFSDIKMPSPGPNEKDGATRLSNLIATGKFVRRKIRFASETPPKLTVGRS